MAFTPQLPLGASGTNPSFTSVSGSRGTDSVGSSAARRDVSEEMITFKNYRRPIMTGLLSNKFGSKPTGNAKFEWMESSLLPATDVINTAITAAAGIDTMTPGDIKLYQVGTKFVIDVTGEVAVVDTVASTTINITKVGTGNFTAVDSGFMIHFLGDVFEQGSASATAKSVNKSFPYNYVEIYKKAVQVTNSQKAHVEYGPEDFNEQKLNRFEETVEAMELAFLHGVRDLDTSGLTGSFEQRYSGGAFDTTAAYITQKFAYSGTAPSEEWFFDTFMPGAFARGSDRKKLYAGQKLVSAISKFSKDKIQTLVTEQAYGKKLLNVISDFGTLDVVWHPMLDGAVHSYRGLVLDETEGKIKMRYLAGNGINRDLQYEDFGEYYKQSDSQKGQWIAECGWQIEGNLYHCVIDKA